MKKVLSFLILVSMVLCGISLCGANSTTYAEGTQVEKDAEVLYYKIHEFLDATKDCAPEDFEKVCVDYMLENSDSLTVLDKDAFEAQTKSDLRLYRGVPKKEFADDFKSGNIYIGGGLRGKGIYTTTSLDCAIRYTDEVGEVINLAMNKDAKVVEMPYLEEVLLKMREMHPEEFTFDDENVMFDSMQGWFEANIKKYLKDDYPKYLDGTLSEEKMKSLTTRIEENEEFQRLSKVRKRYYKDKKAAVFYNCGLSARLLGYDALHSIDFLRNFVSEKEEEYLILNAGVLAVCK